MKRTLFLLLAIIPFIPLMSCSDDDDDKNSKNSIIGLWETYSIWSNGEWNRLYVGNDIYNFKTDNTYSQYSNEEDYKKGKTFAIGTYNFDGKTLSLNGGFKRKVEFSDDGNSFKWEEYYLLIRYIGN